MATVTVEVTAEDIATGQQRSCQRCPIALAINRLLCPRAFVEVGSEYLWIFPEDWRADWSRVVQLRTPREARGFIARFDSKGPPVDPRSFTLEIPDCYLAPAAVQP